MGADELEFARRAYAAFNRRDVDGLLDYLDPQIEWHMSDAFGRGQVFHGHEGVRQVFALFDDALEDMRAEPSELLDGGHAVIAPVRISGRLRGTQEPVVYDLVQVWTLEGLRAKRLDVYATLGEAWAMTGISPPRTTSDSTSEGGSGLANR